MPNKVFLVEIAPAVLEANPPNSTAAKRKRREVEYWLDGAQSQRARKQNGVQHSTTEKEGSFLRFTENFISHRRLTVNEGGRIHFQERLTQTRLPLTQIHGPFHHHHDSSRVCMTSLPDESSIHDIQSRLKSERGALLA